MTSPRQTDANRRNALLSTGPRTEDGKLKARGNAYRHGLTAETVIVGAEDATEYAAFEAEIIGEYDPKSVVERELTLRLASLLWRLRRASLIETGLLQIHCQPSSDSKDQHAMRRHDTQPFHNAIRLLEPHTSHSPRNPFNRKQRERNENGSGQENGGDAAVGSAKSCANKTRITGSFLQLAELPSAPFEHISRYEAALWRQFVQVLFAIDEAKRHRLVALRPRFTPYPPQW